MLLTYEPFKHLSRTLPEIYQGVAGEASGSSTCWTRRWTSCR